MTSESPHPDAIRRPAQGPQRGPCEAPGDEQTWGGLAHERPKAAASRRPFPAGIKESGEATFPWEATRIVAIRHGETAWNRETRMQGQLDIGLNHMGHRQAQRLALALLDQSFDAIYSSDLLRAQQTAQAFACQCVHGIVTDPGLRERCFGIFEGLTYREVQVRWPDQAQRWHDRDPDYGPQGGELLREFDVRCMQTLTRLAAAHPGQHIAIVTHGGVLDCLYRTAARIGLQAERSWDLGNASINRLLHTPQGFTLVGWSDTAHLEGAALDDANAARSGELLGADLPKTQRIEGSPA
jgi:2,3-bisphosphoglycerate-dependent phosphoglycerate mutase